MQNDFENDIRGLLESRLRKIVPATRQAFALQSAVAENLRNAVSAGGSFPSAGEISVLLFIAPTGTAASQPDP
ncbi:MAG: hypothetical protein KJN89_10070 [Gammaproteobacteria bacterium]|nr:hypothetical protein [Gammaproteobacteria bacterium]MBT8134221.1 hypothetical protein [Gammaproteobacteria bacterium]NNJ50710.1 hypothetical protein [Gammaproteobacteria bacterium]